jgi:endo-1,4-beta-D-glucanase Y/nitrate reductase NapAB chaperone NapD
MSKNPQRNAGLKIDKEKTMKRNFAIAALVMLALLSACKNPDASNPEEAVSYKVKINMSGNVMGDRVFVSPVSGQAGTEITINYTIADSASYNRLIFSGANGVIAPADSAETGTRKYTINAQDAVENVITINAVFTHSNTQPNPQPDSFTVAINMAGNVNGDSVTASPTSGKAGEIITISYTVASTKIHNLLVFSGTQTAIAQVDSAETGTRKYTINEADSTERVITINAVFTHTDKTPDKIAFEDADNVTKAYGDASFTKAITNTGLGSGAISYTSSDPTVATVNSTGAVTILKVGTTTITATKATDATYEQAIATYTLTVTKAVGRTVSVPTKASVTFNSITINAVTITPPNPGNQSAEYAISTAASPVPENGWQTGLTFGGLTPNTNYYVFARSKENDNCHTGAAVQVSAAIKTSEVQTIEVPRTTIVDFETDALNKTYESTKGGSAPTVKVVTDPINAGQKSLQITSSDYNQAAIIPLNLPVELQNYKSFSFRFNLLSSANLTNQSIMVYVAKSTADFKQYGFGNPADSSYAQFADKLLGKTTAETIGDNHRNKWTAYTLTISNPGAAIKDLKGDIYIAIGINVQNGANYLIDDLKFEMKDGYNPPPIVILPAPIPPTTGAAVSGNYRNMFVEWGKTEAEVTAKVNNTFNKLFNGTETEKVYYTVGSDMAYILDSGNNDVRSEGMSYGMMMCVQLDKKAEFDRLWKWAKTNMYNPVNNGKNSRGYFAWQCGTDGSKKDVNPAPDGEFYFVTALLFASARWGDGTGDFNYGKWARQVLYDMLHRTAPPDPYGEPPMFNKDNNMVYFTPYGGGLHTDPSYHLPAFYEVWVLELEKDWKNNKLYDTANTWKTLAELKTDIDFYKQAVQASRAFFPKTTNATTGLGPDYANFDGTPTGGEHADFKYDAWRIVMNSSMDYAWWAADPWQKTFADRIQAFFVSKGVNSYGSLWQLNGTLLNANSAADHSPGLVACNAVASLAATHENAWKFIENFWEMPMTSGQYRYYDGCLYMLGLLHVSGNFKVYLSK